MPTQPTRLLPQWLAYIEAQHPLAIAMGLERVREVALRMGLSKPAPHVITVAGTNGKGSTVAFIEAIARAQGWKVAAYTSPHLLRYNERVRIDGREVVDAALVQAFEIVERARRGGAGLDPGSPMQAGVNTSSPVPLTYFEFGTLAALWLFQSADPDLVVLEVGLGGRLDATNLVDCDVAVITTVDLDHQDWLGEDREAIGGEKAGIARAGKPLIIGEDDPPASVLRHAYAIGARAIRAGCDYHFEPGVRPAVDDWCWRELGYALRLPPLRWGAPIQMRNAATAIAALRALDAQIDATTYAHGIEHARIAARLQRVQVDGVEILIDIGHNPQAAAMLAQALRAEPAPGRTFAIYGALADKDHAAVVHALAAQVDRWLLAGSLDAGARGQSADALAARLAQTPAAAAVRYPTVALALAAARARARAGDRILVFGSFQVAVEALAVLRSIWTRKSDSALTINHESDGADVTPPLPPARG